MLALQNELANSQAIPAAALGAAPLGRVDNDERHEVRLDALQLKGRRVDVEQRVYLAGSTQASELVAAAVVGHEAVYVAGIPRAAGHAVAGRQVDVVMGATGAPVVGLVAAVVGREVEVAELAVADRDVLRAVVVVQHHVVGTGGRCFRWLEIPVL